MSDAIYVGKRFAVRKSPFMPEYMHGVAGRVTKVYGGESGRLFDVEFFDAPKRKDSGANWYTTRWVMASQQDGVGAFEWWPDADYFEHDWQGAADRKRDEILGHMFKSKGGLFN